MILRVHLVEVELAAGLGEVVQCSRVGRERFGLLGQLGFLQELCDRGRDRSLSIARFRQHRDTIVQSVEFSLFTLAMCCRVLGIFADG